MDIAYKLESTAVGIYISENMKLNIHVKSWSSNWAKYVL